MKIKTKIKGVGLDCTSLSYKPDPDFLPDYLYIDTSSNNGFYLSGVGRDKELVIRVEELRGLQEVLEGALFDIGRSEISVLLIPAEEIINGDIDKLGKVLDQLEIWSVGIDRPESLEHLKKATEKLKSVIIPSYISLEISPVHFQKEEIDWAEEEGLGIIGLNPFGGYLSAPTVIDSFSLPFLLSFAALYSDFVFLSSRDIVGSEFCSAFLRGLIGGELESGVYEMKNSVNHLVKRLPKIIHTAMTSIGGDIPYNNPLYLADSTELRVGLEEITANYSGDSADDDVSEIMKSVSEFSMASFPDVQYDTTKISMIRPKLIIELSKSIKNSKISQAKIGDTVFLISIITWRFEKRYFWKDKKIESTNNFILYLENGSPVFKSLL